MSTHICPACGLENEQSAKFCGNCGGDLSDEYVGANRIGETILGRYTIRRVIAAGGMGVVYEADQQLAEFHRTVAIKMLRPELSHDQVVVSRFNRECGIVAQLSHQNTVRLYDFGTAEDGTLYIAMEYVRGESLAATIAKGALPVERTLGIMEQMCHALNEAHELGIVHRDLKPDNVVLTQHGSQADFVKLLDFGIAVRLGTGGQHETKLTQQGMILGTPPYMSPEQFTGAPVTRQSDIYSLGIILYEALTGLLPFEADSPWTWAQRHLTSVPPELPANFPASLVATVRSALAKDPSERPRSALEMYWRITGKLIDESRLSSPSPVVSGLETHKPVTTQRDAPIIAPVDTERPRRDTPTATTDPAGSPIMTNGAPVFANTPVRVELSGPADYRSYVSPIAKPGYASSRGPRRGTWIAIAIAIGLLLCVGGISLAYWLDLIENPFQSDEPPKPWAASAPSSQADAPTGLSPAVPQAGVELAPIPQPVLPGQNSMDGVGPRTRVAVPNSGSSTQHGSPTTSASGTSAPTAAPSASPGTVTWPPFITGLPTSLPSLPSNFPPLPSSIVGIPLPPIFQSAPVSPAPNPSNEAIPPAANP